MLSNRQTMLTAILRGSLAAVAAVAPAAKAALFNGNGEPVGKLLLHRLPRGTLRQARIEGPPIGAHALHVHETGTLEPAFDSRGGHFNLDDMAASRARTASMPAICPTCDFHLRQTRGRDVQRAADR